VPDANKFENYPAKKGKDSGVCTAIGSKRHVSYKIFSIDYVDYCSQAGTGNITINSGETKIHTDKYLGIFGMFFQL
ncbi:MAG TPA: hypothetical protein VET23_14995, partial [Chitinophagaceae bacterium]|nr:hypothetical protein [Chitinophagaceae bacterium]